jgi:putative peptide zinc metalloprotease protein
VNRMTRNLVAVVVAAGVVLAPTAAGATDVNWAYARNRTDGAAVLHASVEYSRAGKTVDQINYARADASCLDCQTVAVAFQLVVVTKDPQKFAPRNRADAANVLCAGCLTWATAKQVIVATGGPATLTGAGHERMRALEARLEALEADLPAMSLEALHAQLDAAFGELMAIAEEEVVRTDGGDDDDRVVATRSA